MIISHDFVMVCLRVHIYYCAAYTDLWFFLRKSDDHHGGAGDDCNHHNLYEPCFLRTQIANWLVLSLILLLDYIDHESENRDELYLYQYIADACVT